jgi:hypothetical protein
MTASLVVMSELTLAASTRAVRTTCVYIEAVHMKACTSGSTKPVEKPVGEIVQVWQGYINQGGAHHLRVCTSSREGAHNDRVQVQHRSCLRVCTSSKVLHMLTECKCDMNHMMQT